MAQILRNAWHAVRRFISLQNAGSLKRTDRSRSWCAESHVERLEPRLLLAAWDVVGVRAISITSVDSLPTFLTAPPHDAEHLFIGEQKTGAIRLFDKGHSALEKAPFLTIPDSSRSGGEGGLLCMAFDPLYEATGYFFVCFVQDDASVHVRRYTVSSNPKLADEDSGRDILTISQSQTNHFGGWIAFGPDGFLYVAVGDGGGSDDNGSNHTPDIGNAQDLSKSLGKILRIDVRRDDFPNDATRNYAIPADNPFVAQSGAVPEIWAYGVRNPWRNAFDTLTGDLYIADVGQNTHEEINVQPAASEGGENYGWRLREGTVPTQSGGVGGPSPAGAIDPIYDYTHGTSSTQGNSITGGFVYRGPIDEIQGFYFFADYVNKRIWSLQYDGSAPAAFNGTNYTNFLDWTNTFSTADHPIGSITAFGQDADGNVYVLDAQHRGVFEIVTSETRLLRVYNPNAGLHVLTTSQAEFDALVSLGYLDESSGQAGPSLLNYPVSGSTAVHRLYNPDNGQHYLTYGDQERDFLVGHGWNSEGDVGYIYPTQLPGTLPVYHLYNENSGSHLFTVSKHERDFVLGHYPDIWVEHSILGYGFEDGPTDFHSSSQQSAQSAPAVAVNESEVPVLVEFERASGSSGSLSTDVASRVMAASSVTSEPLPSPSPNVIVQSGADAKAERPLEDEENNFAPDDLDAVFAMLAIS